MFDDVDGDGWWCVLFVWYDEAEQRSVVRPVSELFSYLERREELTKVKTHVASV